MAAKLRWDPLAAALLADFPEGLGEVADLGCGRGQFAALLLEARLAERVTGLERNLRLLGQACSALRGLAFEGVGADLTAAPPLPVCETVLLFDVLYQLSSGAQDSLLARAAGAARRRVLIRTADPHQGLRARFTRATEYATRRVWPHAGDTVNARPVEAIAATLDAKGFAVETVPCWRGTPFANVLVRAERR